MPRRTFEEAQETRRCILDKAIETLAVSGYEKFSMEDMARNLDLTRGAIYHHFKSKEGLFREVVVFLLGEMERAILRYATAGPGAGNDPWESLVFGCEGFLRESQEEAYQRIILIEAPTVLGAEEWQRLDDRYTTAPLIEVLEMLSNAGEITAPHVEAAARALSGAMNQLSLWITSPDDLVVAHESMRLLLGALRTR